MSLCHRISDQAFRTTKALRKLDQLDMLQDPLCTLSCVHLKGKHPAKASCLLFHHFISRMLWQSRIKNLCYAALSLQPLCNRHGIFLCTLHPDSQCLNTTQDQPAVKGCQCCSCRLVEEPELLFNILSVCHKEAGDRVVVASKIFGAAVHNNISAQ